MAVCIEAYIIWFEVAENYILLVQRLQCTHDFANVSLGLVFAERLLQLEVLTEVAALAKLHDHIQMVRRLERVIDFDDERMIDFGHLRHDLLLRVSILS